MKNIKVTFIDTAGHGYYSVSKKDIEKLDLVQSISHYSGHNLTRVFLEEDSDATKFFETADNMGYTVVVKSSYNERFRIIHNYDPSCFRIAVGDKVKLINGETCLITGMDYRSIYLERENFRFYRISTNNPFQWIESKVC